jgi:hypothetical protein
MSALSRRQVCLADRMRDRDRKRALETEEEREEKKRQKEQRERKEEEKRTRYSTPQYGSIRRSVAEWEAIGRASRGHQ